MVKLSEIELPVTFKRHLLFKSGNWNGWDIKSEEVDKSVSNTKWNKMNSSLIYSHKDNEAEAWIGNVKNIVAQNGAAYGDLEIWDPDTALKAKYGEAAFAVSAGIAWPDKFEQPTNFFYRNFSLVSNPGVQEKDIFLNFSANDKVGEYNTAIFSSSLNEISESDNTPKEVVTEQVTPLENEVKPIEEVKPELTEEKVTEIAKKLATEIVNQTLQETNIIERRTQEKSSMENEKEDQINAPVADKVEVKNEAQPIKQEEKVEPIVQATPMIQPELDEKAINSIADKLAEKINLNAPAPVTTNEFASGDVNSEDAVVDRLVTNLLKH